MEKFTYTGNRKAIEMFLMGIFTLYTITFLLISAQRDWNGLWDICWFAGLLIVWLLYLTKYKNYDFRMKVFAIVVQVSVFIYAMHAKEFEAAVPTVMVFVVLLGLSGIASLVANTLILVVAIFVYHIWGAHTIPVAEIPIVMSQLSNVLLLQFAVFTWTKRNNEGSTQLLSVIDELTIVQNSKDDFMANVSHEIRTPINTICGMSEVVLREELPAHVRENIMDIQVAGRNLMGVVSDVLDFSELQSGRIEIEKEAYNITSTINDIISMTMAKIAEKKLELVIDCDASIPSVLLGDEKKIRRIIMNIIDNAVKFTDEGYVALRIGYRREEYGINLMISVKDSGIGISESNLERIFTNFNQADTSSRRHESGLGLGLAICNALLRCVGGAFTIKSKEKKGTTVQIVVPQSVLDEKPMAALQNKKAIKAAICIGVEEFGKSSSYDEYMSMIENVIDQLQGSCSICRTLAELQRRESAERYTHLFVSIMDYRKDREYFDELARRTKVYVIIDSCEEKEIDNPNIFKIYKPIYILPILSVLNNYRQTEAGKPLMVSDRFTTENAHVLLVDDNYMNLRVAEEILKKYNIKVTTAMSGKEALDKIMSANYDFVFLDHMMPELDGVETLQRIRQKPGTYYAKVPIVALTANAVAGAREELLRAGFSDFLEKPIERSVLERVLRRNLPPNKIISKQEEGVTSPEVSQRREYVQNEPEQNETLEIEGLDCNQGMRYCNGEEFYIEVLGDYCQSTDETGMLARKSYELKDWKNYTIAVHGIKSAMFSIGANEIAEMAKKLELAGKESRIDYIESHHGGLMEKYDALFVRLKSNRKLFPGGIVAEEGEQELPELGADSLQHAINKLEDAAYALDGEAMMSVIEELEGFQYQGEKLKQVLAPVKRKVEMSDYFSAVDSVVKWEDGRKHKEN